MRGITGQLTDGLSGFLRGQSVAKAEAFPVDTFRELMEHVAKLAYLNKDHFLFFRGQNRDFKNKAGASTFYPSIYRGERVSKEELDLRFDILSSAASRLCKALEESGTEGYLDVKRRKYIQWSILQHYEVCPTPLLDFTHSVRVAASFALIGSKDGDPYVSVFGLPYITNRISVNSEHDIVNIRLLSICPPDALRPYFQEGYLAGTDEITTEYISKDELDFNNRLIAKFRLKGGIKFWGEGFEPIPESALYPPNDQVEEICYLIKEKLGEEVGPVHLGNFLQEWAYLENLLLTMARKQGEKVFSLREAISILSRYEFLPFDIEKRLDKIRRIRNQAVHRPWLLKTEDLSFAFQEIKVIRAEIKKMKSRFTF